MGNGSHFLVRFHLKHGGKGDERKAYQQWLFGRKSELVSKTNLAVVVLAAAFGMECDHIGDGLRYMMFVVMSLTMHALLRRMSEAAHDMMVFRTKMEVDVQVKGDKQQIKRHQQGSDLKRFLFHDAKVRDISYSLIKKPIHIWIFFIFASSY